MRLEWETAECVPVRTQIFRQLHLAISGIVCYNILTAQAVSMAIRRKAFAARNGA